VFATGHKATGIVDPAAPRFGLPKHKLEAQRIFANLDHVLKEGAARRRHVLRIDQYYTMARAVDPYHEVNGGGIAQRCQRRDFAVDYAGGYARDIRGVVDAVLEDLEVFEVFVTPGSSVVFGTPYEEDCFRLGGEWERSCGKCEDREANAETGHPRLPPRVQGLGGGRHG